MEAQLQRLAERQHGVVGTWQLEGRARPDHRVSGGHWERVSRTVLRRRGSPRTEHQTVMAAILDAGPTALASHRTAAGIWGLPGFGLLPVEVTSGGRRSSWSLASATRHRPRLLSAHHRTERLGIPVTTVGRTIFDLAAGGVKVERLQRLVSTVASRSPGVLTSLHDLLAELAGRGRPGIRVMREVLACHPLGAPTPMSGLERRFEQLLVDAGVAPLRRQVDLGGHEWVGRVDYLDPDLGLVVEVDSGTHHSSPVDRENDATRDARLLASGVRQVLRIPEEHIWYEPWRAVEAVREARTRLRALNWVRPVP